MFKAVAKDIIFNELYLDFDQDLVIVEGAFDAVIAGPNAVPILGSTLRENSKLFQLIVKNDTPIYIGNDTVIGFVAETYQNSSLVALLSTPGFASTAYIFGPNIYTTAVGIGGGEPRIHVPQGITLNIGDLVVLPSVSPGIYGTVSAIDSVPERAEQYGYLTTDKPISSLKVVAVGTRPLSVMEFDEARAVVEEARREFLSIGVPAEFLIEAQSSTSTATSTEEGLEADAEVNTESE